MISIGMNLNEANFQATILNSHPDISNECIFVNAMNILLKTG